MPKATQKFSKQIGPVTYDNGNCSKCGRYISRSSDFARHAITHMELGDKDASMYYCPHEGCAYKTLQKSNLESHFNVHTGEKPYACPECPFSSANPSSLCRHRQRLHGYVPSARRTRPGSGPATFSRPRVPQEDGPVMNGTPAATVPRRTGRASKNQNNPVDNSQSDHDAQGQPSQHPPPDQQQQQQAQHPPPPPPPPQPLTFINHAPPPPDGMINGPIPVGPPMPHMMFPPHFAHFVPMQGGPPPMGPPPSGPPPMGHIQHVHMGPLPPVPPPLGMPPPPPGMHPQGMPQAPPPPPLVPQAPAPPEAERSAPSPPRAPGEAEEKPKIEKRTSSPSPAKAASPASVSRSPSPKATSNVREVSDLRTPVV